MGLKVPSRDELARRALEVVERVKETDKVVKGAGSSFRTRARELFEVAHYLGCLQTISFAYAKATTARVADALEYLEGRESAERLRELEGERAGYGLYAAALLSYLKAIGVAVDPRKLNEILDAVSKYEFLVLPFMSWLKLMAEAELGGG